MKKLIFLLSFNFRLCVSDMQRQFFTGQVIFEKVVSVIRYQVWSHPHSQSTTDCSLIERSHVGACGNCSPWEGGAPFWLECTLSVWDSSLSQHLRPQSISHHSVRRRQLQAEARYPRTPSKTGVHRAGSQTLCSVQAFKATNPPGHTSNWMFFFFLEDILIVPCCYLCVYGNRFSPHLQSMIEPTSAPCPNNLVQCQKMLEP